MPQATSTSGKTHANQPPAAKRLLLRAVCRADSTMHVRGVILRVQPRGSVGRPATRQMLLPASGCRLSRTLGRSANLQQSHVCERICRQNVCNMMLSVLSSSAVPYACLKAHCISLRLPAFACVCPASTCRVRIREVPICAFYAL